MSAMWMIFVAAVSPDATWVRPAPVESPLTEERAREIARSNNIDLQISRERVAKAALYANKAWSFVLPSLSAQAQIARNNTEIAFTVPTGPGEPPTSITVQKLWQSNASLTANWTLLSGRTIPSIKNAYAVGDVAEAQYAQMEATLLHTVSLAFFNVVSAQQSVAVQRRALEVAKEHLRLAKGRQAVGTATEVTVMRADVEVASAEQNLLSAENALSLSKLALATLLGWAEPNANVPAFDVAAPPTPELTTEVDANLLLAQALTQREDLRARTYELEIAERTRHDTIAQFFPQLNAFGQLNWSDAEGFAGQNTTWQVGLRLTWSIFQGGFTFWELQEQGHDLTMARLAIDKTRLDVTHDVLEAVQDLASAQRGYTAADKRAALAARAAELTEAQYELGGATQIELLDAERSHQDAQTAKIMSELQLRVAQLTLDLSLLAPTSPTAGAITAAATPDLPTAAE